MTNYIWRPFILVILWPMFNSLGLVDSKYYWVYSIFSRSPYWS